jgi:hypothetical protein
MRSGGAAGCLSQYYCITETSSGEIRKLLLRADPPEMEETEEGGSSRLTSLAHSTISLTCRANGQPSPNITWTKEAKRYQSHISSLSNMKYQSLQIRLKTHYRLRALVWPFLIYEQAAAGTQILFYN